MIVSPLYLLGFLISSFTFMFTSSVVLRAISRPASCCPEPPLKLLFICLFGPSFCFPDRSKAPLLRVLTIYESDTAATMALVEYIVKYLPSPATLQQELQLWHSRWKCVDIFQVDHWTPVTNKAMFPNIHTLLCIICTLPVTSCKYEC